MSTANRKSQTAKRRRGLSTLEMVLALPILLFVMALMINIGNVACWKVRALTVARHAVWGTRWPRTGTTDPKPHYWPDPTGIGIEDLGNVPELDDPRIDLPVARGSLEPGATVNVDLLDPPRGLRQGSVTRQAEYPLLAKMGNYVRHAKTQLLDDKWQYQRMGLPHNAHRRIPVIYALAKAPPSTVDAYVQAVVTLLGAPFQPQLRPLDQDDEFIYYRPMLGQSATAPDFHPRLRRFCSLDPIVADASVTDVVDRIQGKKTAEEDVPSVAEVMAQAFINLYESVLNLDPVPPPGPTALQVKIDQLKQFLASL